MSTMVAGVYVATQIVSYRNSIVPSIQPALAIKVIKIRTVNLNAVRRGVAHSSTIQS